MDDGTDPHRATGPSSPRLLTDGGPTAQEVRDRRNRRPAEPSRESPEAPREQPRRAGESCLGRRRPQRSRTRFQSRASSSADPDPPAFPMPVQYPDGSMGIPFTAGVSPYAETQGRRRPGTRSQASSSSATRSDHLGAEERGTGTRVRQSVLYSDRRPRHTRGSALHPVTGTHVWQSVLYSDRPRQSPPIRPAPAEEHPGMVSSSELDRAVTDLPAFEGLSLIDPPLLTPQTADETDDDEVPPEPVGFGFGFGSLAPQTLRYSARPPRPKWLGGVRGQEMLEENAGDASSSDLDSVVTDSSRSEELSVTISSFAPQSTMEKPTEDPDDDIEEELRLLEEYFAAHPPVSIRQALDELKAANYAALASQAAEWGIEPPPPPPPRQFLADQAQQEASVAVHPQHSAVPRKPRREASTEEIVENAKKWMRDEVIVVFQNYIGRRDDPMIVDFSLDELRHQCVSVENYHKIFHHYNFTVKLKKANSDDWTSALYFAEVKQMFGRKSYFCCLLEPNENGLCYACQNQGVDDLRHPATGGFEMGLPDASFSLWYPDE